MVCEIKVRVKSNSLTLTEKALIYEPITADFHDPIIRDLIKQATKKFGGDQDEYDVKVSIKLL